MTTTHIWWARELVRDTLRGMGVKSVSLDWTRCPACHSPAWTEASSYTGIPEVCYPCGLLALLAEAEADGGFDPDLRSRYELALEWEEIYCPTHKLFWCWCGRREPDRKPSKTKSGAFAETVRYGGTVGSRSS